LRTSVGRSYTIREGADWLSRDLGVRIPYFSLRALVRRKRVPFYWSPGPRGHFFFTIEHLRVIARLYRRGIGKVE
jgi:hypothetical protein